MYKRQVIYRSIIVDADKSPDGETPTEIVVTQEVNTLLVWLCGHNEGSQIIHSDKWNRDAAIEWAVDKAREMRGQAVNRG